MQPSEIAHHRAQILASVEVVLHGYWQPDDAQGLRAAVDTYERSLVEASLQRHTGNWAAAARELQMDRANLQRLARRLGIAQPERPAPG